MRTTNEKSTGGLMYTRTADKIFDAVNYLILAVIMLLVVYPLIFVLSASFSDPFYVVTGQVFFLPKGFTVDSYRRVFSNSTIIRGYANSIFYTVLGTSLSMILTSFAAFALSRPDLKGRKFFTVMITLTMFFSGGLIPLYLIVQKLNLLGSFWSIILPTAMSAYNMIIMRSYFEASIPFSIQEAAVIDGCSPFKLLIKIILPLSLPVIAVVALYYAVARWNSYFSCMLYMGSSKEWWTLQLVIREIVIQSTTGDMIETGLVSFEQIMAKEAIKYTVIIVSSLPLLIAYPFIQRYFVKGVMIGAVKG